MNVLGNGLLICEYKLEYAIDCVKWRRMYVWSAKKTKVGMPTRPPPGQPNFDAPGIGTMFKTIGEKC